MKVETSSTLDTNHTSFLPQNSFPSIPSVVDVSKETDLLSERSVTYLRSRISPTNLEDPLLPTKGLVKNAVSKSIVEPDHKMSPVEIEHHSSLPNAPAAPPEAAGLSISELMRNANIPENHTGKVTTPLETIAKPKTKPPDQSNPESDDSPADNNCD